MLRIKNVKKADTLATLSAEINFLTGLKDNLTEIQNLPEEALDPVHTVISRNAIIAGIEKGSRKAIPGNPDLLDVISHALTGLTIWAGMLEGALKGAKSQTFDTETITFKERGLLDAISAINYFNRYTDMLLDVLTTSAYENIAADKILTKIDLAMFNNTALYYTTLLIRFNQSPKDLNEMIDKLSDEVADELSEEILRGADGDAAVSIRKGLAPHELNPVHWYQLWVMRRDVETIRNGQRQIDVLAMKIARLNNKAAGVEDPSLDHAINVYTDEIIKIKARNRAIVEKYNG